MGGVAPCGVRMSDWTLPMSQWSPSASTRNRSPVGSHASPPSNRARSERSGRTEEHTSELPSLMRTPYAVCCVKNKTHVQLTRADPPDIQKLIPTTHTCSTLNHTQ